MLKKSLRAGLLLALCLAMLAGCAGGGNGKAEQKLTFTLPSLPTIDPQLFNSAASYPPIKGYVEGLVTTSGGKVMPGVAESWDIAADNMSMTFHLRSDAQWSDGSKLTANDFVYAFRRLADPKNNCDYRWVLSEIVNGGDIAYGDGSIPVDQLGVSAPDDNTFVITFNTPAPYYLDFLDMPCFYPVKQALVEQYGDQYALASDKLLGNGPFIVKEYLVDQKMVLVPNDKYWNKNAVKLEEVTIIIMEAEAAFAAYRSGEIDMCNIPVAVAPSFKENPAQLENSAVNTYMSGAVDWFCVNLASTTNPILGNQDFRLALNYALDREQYVKIATNGLYQPASRFVLPIVKGVSKPYCEEYPIDVYQSKAETDKAKEHLQKAMQAMGISDPGSITIALKISDDATGKLIVENCQDQWQKALGIKVNIETVTYKAMLSDRVAGNFDLVYAGWMPDYDDPYTYLSYFMSGNSQNGGKYSNARYDELVGTANNYADPATRLSMYAEAEKLLMEEAGIVPLQVRQDTWVRQNNLQGIVRYYLGASPNFIYAYFE